MSLPHFRSLLFWATCAVLITLPSAGAGAQTTPEIQDLAERTAARTAQANPQRILLVRQMGCLADEARCTPLYDALSAELKKALPGVALVGHADFIALVKKRGFVAVDAYNDDVFKRVVPDAEAQIVVRENVVFSETRPPQLETSIVDAVKLASLQFYDATLPALTDQEPFVYREPESGIGVVVPRGKTASSKVFRVAVCDSCPVPPYPSEANRLRGTVALLLTVNTKGRASDVIVLDSPNRFFSDAAVKAASSWKFKPAMDANGMPFAMRIPMAGNFDPDSGSGGGIGGGAPGGGGRGRR